ncbi:MAG: hypothetical protein ACQER7_03790 [Bacteroidota bacterium]
MKKQLSEDAIKLLKSFMKLKKNDGVGFSELANSTKMSLSKVRAVYGGLCKNSILRTNYRDGRIYPGIFYNQFTNQYKNKGETIMIEATVTYLKVVQEALKESKELSKIKITADKTDLSEVIDHVISVLEMGMDGTEIGAFTHIDTSGRRISAEETRNIDPAKERILIYMRLKTIAEALEDIGDFIEKAKWEK